MKDSLEIKTSHVMNAFLCWVAKISFLVLFMWMGAIAQSANAATELKSMRVGEQSNLTRVVFDFNDLPSYQIQTLASPNRLVLDFAKTDNKLSFSNKYLQDPRLFSITVQNTAKHTRVILALHKSMQFKYFSLGKNKSGHERLVVDLLESASSKPLAAKKWIEPKPSTKSLVAVNKPAQESSPVSIQKPIANRPTSANTPPVKMPSRSEVVKQEINLPNKSLAFDFAAQSHSDDEIVVAIDAGHGGKDPGAIGSNGIYEKTVTLAVAKRLKQLIDLQPNMRAVLTRDQDKFIALKDRVKIAKQNHADIFISIHADAFEDSRVKGGSVYVLSERGASSTMAQLIAESENKSLQEIPLGNLDNDVIYALSDMTREANIRVSRKLANNLVQSMARKMHMHKATVQSANFAVLKTIDMPAMLIETAFLSNPDEARKLKDPKFQHHLASAITDGLNQFVLAYKDQPRWGEKLYITYKVKSGDTLSEIAEQFGTTVAHLKRINNIQNPNALYQGKLMRIPVADRQLAGI